MPRLALTLCVISFVSLFVVRSVVQWMRTGSTGWKGVRGTPGSVKWWAGILVALGFLLTLGSPVVALLDAPGGALLFSHRGWHTFGAAVFCAGTVGTLIAQLSMGDSWRVGVDESERTHLVTTGLFAWVRNPIFSFMIAAVIGLVLLLPNPMALLAAIATIVGIELHVRVTEEPYLSHTHGADYDAYASRVGRFVPGIGRIRPAVRGTPAGHHG